MEEAVILDALEQYRFRYLELKSKKWKVFKREPTPSVRDRRIARSLRSLGRLSKNANIPLQHTARFQTTSQRLAGMFALNRCQLSYFHVRQSTVQNASASLLQTHNLLCAKFALSLALSDAPNIPEQFRVKIDIIQPLIDS